jgi:NAD(P)-dependent dehydrogenase (short-subunit alcohol dehydrogenase family)
MAARKMTFSIPEAVAKEFLRTVAARNRSKYVANALAARLKAEETALARACDLANASEDIHAMEREFDAISADITESWTDATPR